jgi:hypothetical protein
MNFHSLWFPVLVQLRVSDTTGWVSWGTSCVNIKEIREGVKFCMAWHKKFPYATTFLQMRKQAPVTERNHTYMNGWSFSRTSLEKNWYSQKKEASRGWYIRSDSWWKYLVTSGWGKKPLKTEQQRHFFSLWPLRVRNSMICRGDSVG